ncbi:HTH-type transcriptional regulator GltC [Streptomyces sp. RB5]|uniref:HTH-type transcriptional regulator GltC n=1 Tax=Streptomyces smaragdinus TaxID=2585196 RepID=A0A7K0CHI3_9ACTN|nr:LysR family transcriptional regulator [Streptomyces smaragdinus]MQY12955.1 HTH-type transcriptional regulator GltC [Streptomyces smaragdinus]
MDLTRLRILAAVAREGSVTAAADALGYAQPSVSHQLARLEEEAGLPLVQRAGRGIRLTEAGRLLAERAEEITGRVASARAELDALAGLHTGRVRLAAFPTALAMLVPPAAARLARTHPGVELALTEAEPPQALAALRRGDVDVALTFDHRDEPRPGLLHLTTTPLLTEPMYLVTPRTADPTQDLAAHASARWITGCERCRAHLLASCARAGFTPAIGFETDDYVAVQSLVAAGLGVSTLPALALKAHRNPSVTLHRLPADHRHLSTAYYGKPPAPAPVQALLTALHETAGPPHRWPR